MQHTRCRRRRRRNTHALLLWPLIALATLAVALATASGADTTAAAAALLSNRFSSSWALLPVSATSPGSHPPLGICDHMAAYNPLAHTLLLTHGFDNTDSNVDATFVLDLSREDEVSWMPQIDLSLGNIPEARLGGAFMLRHAESYSTGANGAMRHDASYYLQSGLDDTASWADEWSMSFNVSRSSASAELVQTGAKWLKNVAVSPKPLPRVWTVTGWIVHPAGTAPNKLVLFGGTRDDGFDSNDLWLGDFSADALNPAWTELFPVNSPPIMSGHQAAVAGGELWIFGGYLCVSFQRRGMHARGIKAWTSAHRSSLLHLCVLCRRSEVRRRMAAAAVSPVISTCSAWTPRIPRGTCSGDRSCM